MKRLMVVVSLAALLLGAVVPAAGAAPRQSDPVYYRVQWGDVLWRIAAWHGTTTWTVANLNGITNPDRIYAGQQLLIRPGTPTSSYVYTVKWGDTLGNIARRYGMDAWTLARVNGLHNLDLIYVGQKLAIP